MNAPAAVDTNFGLVISDEQRQQVAKLMSTIVGPNPAEFAFLIDRAGRIVEVTGRPSGTKVVDVAALAAGCFATTNALAVELGETAVSLRFRSEDDRQVYIRPFTDRALLAGVATSHFAVQDLVSRCDGPMGQNLMRVLRQAQDPGYEKKPRMVAAEVPNELKRRTKALSAFILDLQTTRPEEMADADTRATLLRSRDELLGALAAADWARAGDVFERIRQWLVVQVGLPPIEETGTVLTDLYTEVLGKLHKKVVRMLAGGKAGVLYTSFLKQLQLKWPTVYGRAEISPTEGLNVAAAWERTLKEAGDPLGAAEEFIPALDGLVRCMLRVAFLSRGPHATQELLETAMAAKGFHRPMLLPHGLDGVVGDRWTDLLLG